MHKVGIVTINDFDNYGNRLQCYAMYNLLKSLKCNPKVIQFVSRSKLRELYFWMKYNIRKFFKYSYSANDARMDMFRFFTKKYIKNLKFYNEMNSINGFDYYICGSDQVWHPRFAGNYFYFLGFAEKKKRISYAASFGISDLIIEKNEEYTRYLSEMSHISVRENAGAQIVKKLTGRDALVLIDPTLMLDRTEWLKIEKRPRYAVPERYILTYFLGEVSDETNKYIKTLAEKNSLEIISLEKLNHNDYWYKTGPSEFIWLIENASLMCTDSFHGSVFSVLMDIPFIVFDRIDNQSSMNSRIVTLLDILKLQDRMFSNQKDEDVFRKEYDHIPEILKKERKKAIDYLKNSMELN